MERLKRDNFRGDNETIRKNFSAEFKTTLALAAGRGEPTGITEQGHMSRWFFRRGETLIVMLAGGDKSTQQADIRRAIALAKFLED